MSKNNPEASGKQTEPWQEFIDKDDERLKREEGEWNERRVSIDTDTVPIRGRIFTDKIDLKLLLQDLEPLFKKFETLSDESAEAICERIENAVKSGQDPRKTLSEILDLIETYYKFEQSATENPNNPESTEGQTPEEVVEAVLRQLRKITSNKSGIANESPEDFNASGYIQ